MSIIVDIDGTLADYSHTDYHQRKPIEPIAELVYLLDKQHPVLVVTGRAERHRRVTEHWLAHHRIPHDRLYMRADGDTRPDWAVKQEMLHGIRQFYSPFLVIDDRLETVEMWRRNGITCLQNGHIE